MQEMLKEEKYFREIIQRKFNKPLKMNKKQEQEFKAAKECHICGHKYTEKDVRVRDQCHITEKYRGSAHEDCNLKLREQESFSHEHARPLNKRCAWRLSTGSAFIKMVRLKAIMIAIILLVGLGECARDLTKCVVCKKTLTWS